MDNETESTVFKRHTIYQPGKSWRRFLIGRPLSTADAPEQTIGKFIGLAVFSSDAMSSVAYAPQEILVILAVAGVSAFHISVPIALAICALLAILIFSYEQTIHAYPDGGGAYIVARDNINNLAAQTAGAALLTDYILTVSVSISSGVAQLVSAFPLLEAYKVEIAVVFIFLIMLINLRGVKEAGTAFAIPTYFFLVMMFTTIIVGFIRLLLGTLGVVQTPPMEMVAIGNSIQPITLFLILKAFASGTTALTGVEAISNGITAFKEPRSKNAGITLIIMALILGSMMLSITYLGNHIGVMPSEEETYISQLARTVFDSRGIMYLLSIASTTIILVMAANTAFAGFPRLAAMAAADGYLPRQLTYRGSRLVFSKGIVALAVIASILVIIFKASVTKLIPLYAIGVFLSFTISQFGMSLRWWKSGHLKSGEKIVEKGSTVTYDGGWLHKMIVNGFGAVITFIVMLIFAVTKFKDGAWTVIVLIPALVLIFSAIYKHYTSIARDLSLDQFIPNKRIAHQRVVMPIGGVHKGTLAALRYAKTLSDDITVVHVSIDPEETRRLQEKWEKWGDGYRLVVLDSPYRLFIEPLLEYIEHLDNNRQPNEMISIVVPQFLPRKPITNWLHTHTAETLRKVLLSRKDIVIMEVPYLVD
ncbi:MAG TPA: APC family permease [Anaerolineaceae bacterium]|nr:APC family permease [Anaerolineaceae bacterium]